MRLIAWCSNRQWFCDHFLSSITLGSDHRWVSCCPHKRQRGPQCTAGQPVGLAELALGAGTALLNQMMRIPEKKNQFPGMASLETWVISSCCSVLNFEMQPTHELFHLAANSRCSGSMKTEGMGQTRGIWQKHLPLYLSPAILTSQMFLCTSRVLKFRRTAGLRYARRSQTPTKD